MLQKLPLLALALLGLAAASVLPDLTLEPDEENVTAGRLAGTWEDDPVVGERLDTAREGGERLTFREDPSVLQHLPAKYEAFLGEKQLFEAGTMETRDAEGNLRRSSPYVLVVHRGNPHLVWFRARDGEPLGDAESCNLFVARGKTRAQDLLLMGGDFGNRPFRAYRRVED